VSSAASSRSPVDIAARALARRDRSELDLRRILARKGVSEDDVDEAIETLRRSGAIDDERFARAAAESLARRGLGDSAIVFRLQRDGIGRELALDAVAELRPEDERANELVARRGADPRNARWLSARGFSRDAVDQAVAAVAESEA
jgi:regulatory protein